MQEFYLLLVMVKHPLQAAGQVVHVEGSVAIGEDVMGMVIAGNDDKLIHISGIEHIIIHRRRIGRRRLGMEYTQGSGAHHRCHLCVPAREQEI